MTALSLFFVLGLGALGVLVIAYGFVLALRGRVGTHAGESPAWVRFHVRYYVFALLFIAFDMEMAYMYPWSVVVRSLGWFAVGEVALFLTALGIGILYAWRERALRWS